MFKLIALLIDWAWALATFALKFLLIYVIIAGSLFGLYVLFFE